MLIEECEIELTTLCNAHCQLCYRNYQSYENRTIIRPLEDVIKQLEEFEHLKRIKLVGTESEPTLYNDFHALVTYLKSRNIEIEICTNGDTNNQQWWEALGELLAEGDMVYFTICGSTQELHETYRKGTRLDHILRNAAALRKNGKGNDYAQCIRFSYNDADFETEKFKNMVSEFSHVYMTETYLLKSEENYVNIDGLNRLTPIKSKSEDYERIARLADVLYKNGGVKKTKCMAIDSQSVQIDINGELYPCYLFLESGNKWDGDWGPIKHGKYEVCKMCNDKIRKMCYDKGLQYII